MPTTGERVEYWSDLVSRNVTPMRIEPRTQPLNGKITARAIGDVTVAEVSGCGIHALHTASEVAGTRHHLDAAGASIKGDARITHRGKQIILQRGDIFVTDSRDVNYPGAPQLDAFAVAPLCRSQ